MLSEEEKAMVESERQFALALSHQLGEMLSKQVKKLDKKVNAEDIFKKDPLAAFLNDMQLLMIRTFGLTAEEIINCNKELLPPKLAKLDITSDEKKACQHAMGTVLASSNVLHEIGKSINEQDNESAKQLEMLSQELLSTGQWLGNTFKINIDEEVMAAAQ